jgi:transcriptional regulator of arginine metabolism
MHVYAFVARVCLCRTSPPPMKTQRQSAIRELLVTTAISNQDELRRKLAAKGINATQATLSRDIREMRLFKGPLGYALPDTFTPEVAEPDLPAIAEMLSSFGLEIRQADNLLVLLTGRGAAHPVAAGIDDEEWPEVLGTIAGDNTILIICANLPAANTLRQRLEAYLA